MVLPRPRALWGAMEGLSSEGPSVPPYSTHPTFSLLAGLPLGLRTYLVLFWPVPLHLSLSCFFAQPAPFPPPLSMDIIPSEKPS